MATETRQFEKMLKGLSTGERGWVMEALVECVTILREAKKSRPRKVRYFCEPGSNLILGPWVTPKRYRRRAARGKTLTLAQPDLSLPDGA